MPVSIGTITISPDCKSISTTFSGLTGNIDATYYNNMTETEVTATVTNVGGSGTWTLSSTTAGETFNGVITISYPDGDIEKYAVGTCELDCCIAGLVTSAINCTCECDKCDEDLRTAEKVRLLSQSAIYSAVELNLTDAINKYNKAKEFCTASCACGC
jgi:hypothetical protein